MSKVCTAKHLAVTRLAEIRFALACFAWVAGLGLCPPGLFAQVGSSSTESDRSAVSFDELWYREVVLGELLPAARGYEGLYGRPGARQETRERAAYRAWRIYELIENVPLANHALNWLKADGVLASPHRLTAIQRLAYLDAAGAMPVESLAAGSSAASTPPVLPGDMSSISDVSIRTILRRFHEESVGRRVVYGRCQLASENLSADTVALDQLLTRLKELGFDLIFDEPRSLPAEGRTPVIFPLAAEIRELIPEATEFRLLSEFLYGRFYAEALEACSIENMERARQHLETAIALLPEQRAAPAFRELMRQLKSRSTLATLARRRLIDFRQERIARARRELRNHVRNVKASSRADRKLRESHYEALRVVEVLPRYVLLDAEISSLIQEIQYYHSTSIEGESVRKFLAALWSWRTIRTREFLRQMAEWSDARLKLARCESRPRRGAGFTASSVVLWKEIRAVEAELARSDLDDAAKKKIHRQVTFLKTWFPEIAEGIVGAVRSRRTTDN